MSSHDLPNAKELIFVQTRFSEVGSCKCNNAWLHTCFKNLGYTSNCRRQKSDMRQVTNRGSTDIRSRHLQFSCCGVVINYWISYRIGLLPVSQGFCSRLQVRSAKSVRLYVSNYSLFVFTMSKGSGINFVYVYVRE